MNERDTELAHARQDERTRHHTRQALRLALVEVDRLRAGVMWARGMCSDREPTVEIDAYLGLLLDPDRKRQA